MARYTGPITKKSRRLKMDLVGGDKNYDLRPFPPGFLWGASTSAYQVEGGWDADGKGPSVIDARTELPAGTADVTVAADHYHRLEEDVALFAEANGLVIDTRDLFRLSRAVTDGVVRPESAREMLKTTSGVFEFSGDLRACR